MFKQQNFTKVLTTSIFLLTTTTRAIKPQSCTFSTMSSFTKITQDKLGISEPNPSWFGNSPNPSPRPETWSSESDNWLKSRFHFNFAEWHGGDNNFGVLRVMNDDLVQPARGFGTHPHSNAEIATYVIEGALTHQDSMGTKESLHRGSVQFMTAGKGVRHSEFNEDPTNPLRFIQMWFIPRKQQLPPNYGSLIGDAQCNKNRLNQFAWLVGDVDDSNSKAAIKINTDANIHVAELDGSTSIDFAVEEGRAAYILQLEGAIKIDGDQVQGDVLQQHEAAKVFGPTKLTFEKSDDKDAKCHVLLVELAAPSSKQ